MQTLTKVIEQLGKFSDNDDVPEILDELREISSIEDKASIKDETIEELRKNLSKILSDSRNESLSAAAYGALIALAEFRPLNDNDPITQDEIEDDDKVFVSTGHQFSISNLMKYHEARAYKRELGETPISKYLINPYTNEKFSQRDIDHIQEVWTPKQNANEQHDVTASTTTREANSAHQPRIRVVPQYEQRRIVRTHSLPRRPGWDNVTADQESASRKIFLSNVNALVMGMWFFRGVLLHSDNSSNVSVTHSVHIVVAPVVLVSCVALIVSCKMYPTAAVNRDIREADTSPLESGGKKATDQGVGPQSVMGDTPQKLRTNGLRDSACRMFTPSHHRAEDEKKENTQVVASVGPTVA